MRLAPIKEEWLDHIGEYSNARYNSTLRAVHSLERKGLVETERQAVSFERYGKELMWVCIVWGVSTLNVCPMLGEKKENKTKLQNVFNN